MSYLHRGNGYQPTGNVNSEPDAMHGDGVDPEGYPAPAPAHELDPFGGDMFPEPGDVEYGAADIGPRQATPEDLVVLERLRKIVGTGPYVIVKLDGPVELLAGTTPVPVTIGWGNGVTEHLAPEVLGMGIQALVDRLRGQEATQELPVAGTTPTG